jgi:hypothetical protein
MKIINPSQLTVPNFDISRDMVIHFRLLNKSFPQPSERCWLQPVPALYVEQGSAKHVPVEEFDMQDSVQYGADPLQSWPQTAKNQNSSNKSFISFKKKKFFLNSPK